MKTIKKIAAIITLFLVISLAPAALLEDYTAGMLLTTMGLSVVAGLTGISYLASKAITWLFC